MADVKIEWFGWYLNESENSDKVWGWINVEGNLYNFWAKRGKRMSFKQHADHTDYWSLVTSKSKKGYKQVSDSDIEKVFPEFYSIVQRNLFRAKMTDMVK